MPIGTLQIQERLIQAVGLVYQAATATPVVVVSATMDTSATGGRLLQSPVPTHGVGLSAPASSMSAATTTINPWAFLLVASGINH